MTESGPLGNRRAEEKHRKGLRITANRRKEALRWIMGDERGRLYLADIVNESQALLSIGGPSPEGAQFYLGKRAMGIKVLEDVQGLDLPGDVPRALTSLMSVVLAKPDAPKSENENDGTDADYTDE